jgi:hypothetical protein
MSDPGTSRPEAVDENAVAGNAVAGNAVPENPHDSFKHWEKKLIETDIFDAKYPNIATIRRDLLVYIESENITTEIRGKFDTYLINLIYITKEKLSKLLLHAYNFPEQDLHDKFNSEVQDEDINKLIRDEQTKIEENDDNNVPIFSILSESILEIHKELDITTERKVQSRKMATRFFIVLSIGTCIWYANILYGTGTMITLEDISALLLSPGAITTYGSALFGLFTFIKNYKGGLTIIKNVAYAAITQFSTFKIVSDQAIDSVLALVKQHIFSRDYFKSGIIEGVYNFISPFILNTTLGIHVNYYVHMLKSWFQRYCSMELQSLTMRSLQGGDTYINEMLDIYKGLVNTYGLSGDQLEYGGQMTNISYNNISVVKNYWLFYYFSDIYYTLDIDFDEVFKAGGKNPNQIKINIKESIVKTKLYSYYLRDLSKYAVTNKYAYAMYLTLQNIIVRLYDLFKTSNKPVDSYTTSINNVVKNGIKNLINKDDEIPIDNRTINMENLYKLKDIYTLMRKYDAFNQLDMYNDELQNGLPDMTNYNQYITLFKSQYNDEIIPTEPLYLASSVQTPEYQITSILRMGKTAIEELIRGYNHGIFSANSSSNPMKKVLLPAFLKKFVVDSQHQKILESNLHRVFETHDEDKRGILNTLQGELERENNILRRLNDELQVIQTEITTITNSLSNALLTKAQKKSIKDRLQDKNTKKEKKLKEIEFQQNKISNIEDRIKNIKLGVSIILKYVDINLFRRITFDPVYLYNLFGFFKNTQNAKNFLLKYLKDEIKEVHGLTVNEYAKKLNEYGIELTINTETKMPTPNESDIILNPRKFFKDYYNFINLKYDYKANTENIKIIKHIMLVGIMMYSWQIRRFYTKTSILDPIVATTDYKNEDTFFKEIFKQYFPHNIYNDISPKTIKINTKTTTFFGLDQKSYPKTTMEYLDTNKLTLTSFIDAISIFIDENKDNLGWFYSDTSTMNDPEFIKNKQNIYAMIQNFIGNNRVARTIHAKFSGVRYFLENQFNFNPYAHSLFRFINVLPTYEKDGDSHKLLFLPKGEGEEQEVYDKRVVHRLIQLSHNVETFDGTMASTYLDSNNPLIRIKNSFTNSIQNYTNYLEYDTKTLNSYINSIYGNGIALQRVSVIPNMSIPLTYLKSMPWQQYINDKFWFYVDPKKRNVVLSFQGTVDECHDSFANLGYGTPHFRVYNNDLYNIFRYLETSKDEIIKTNISLLKSIWNSESIQEAFDKYWSSTKELLQTDGTNKSITQSLASMFYRPIINIDSANYPYNSELNSVLKVIKSKIDPKFHGYDIMNSKLTITLKNVSTIGIKFEEFSPVDNAVLGQVGEIAKAMIVKSALQLSHIPPEIEITNTKMDEYDVTPDVFKILRSKMEDPTDIIGCSDQFGNMAYAVFEPFVLGVFDRKKYLDYINLSVKEKPEGFKKKLYLSNVLEALNKMLKKSGDEKENDIKFFATGHSMGGGTISSFYWLLFYYFIILTEDYKEELLTIIRKTICHAYAPPRAFTMKCSILIDFLRSIILKNNNVTYPSQIQETNDTIERLTTFKKRLNQETAALEGKIKESENELKIYKGHRNSLANEKWSWIEKLIGKPGWTDIHTSIQFTEERISNLKKELEKLTNNPFIQQIKTMKYNGDIKKIMEHPLYTAMSFNHDVHFLCISNPYDPIGKIMNNMYHAGNVVLIHEQFMNYAKHLYRQKNKDTKFEISVDNLKKFEVEPSIKAEMLYVSMNGIQTLTYDKIVSEGYFVKELVDIIDWGSGKGGIEIHDLLQSYNLMDEDTSNTAGGIHNIYSYLTNFKKYEYALELMKSVDVNMIGGYPQEVEEVQEEQEGGVRPPYTPYQTQVMYETQPQPKEHLILRLRRNDKNLTSENIAPLSNMVLPPENIAPPSNTIMPIYDLSKSITNLNILMNEIEPENMTTDIDVEGYKILNIITMLNNENMSAYNNGDMSFLELSMLRGENIVAPNNIVERNNTSSRNNMSNRNNKSRNLQTIISVKPVEDAMIIERNTLDKNIINIQNKMASMQQNINHVNINSNLYVKLKSLDKELKEKITRRNNITRRLNNRQGMERREGYMKALEQRRIRDQNPTNLEGGTVKKSHRNSTKRRSRRN